MRCASVPRIGAHFVQDDGNAGLGDLPGRFAAGEAAADDVNGAHRALVTKPTAARQPRSQRKKTPAGGGPAGAWASGEDRRRLDESDGRSGGLYAP